MVLRTDVANLYGTPLTRMLFSEAIAKPVEQGRAPNAACVGVTLPSRPDQPGAHAACIRNANPAGITRALMAMVHEGAMIQGREAQRPQASSDAV